MFCGCLKLPTRVSYSLPFGSSEILLDFQKIEYFEEDSSRIALLIQKLKTIDMYRGAIYYSSNLNVVKYIGN